MTTTVFTRTVVLAAALAVAVACRGREPDSPPPAAAPAAAGDEGLTGESIFGLDLAFVDDAGQPVQLRDLGGRPFVAAMVYTSCTTICLSITEQMKQIERQLAAAAGDTPFVLFSLDPGRDTPAAMREFAKRHQLGRGRWRLLAASEDGVRDLAAVLGVKYRPEENGEIAHSAMIFVIDGSGVVRYRQVGTAPDPEPLIAALRHARERRARPEH